MILSGNMGADILGDNITSVHKAARHILTVSRNTFSHHSSELESGVEDSRNCEWLMISFFSRDN